MSEILGFYGDIIIKRPTDPKIIKQLGPRARILHTPFRYYIGEKGSDFYVTVPENFCTDFASVPWIFSQLFPKDGIYTPAAILHDWLYFRLGCYDPNQDSLSRKDCDNIFLEAMTVLGVPRWRRQLMYRAVRIGGGFGWRKQAKRSYQEIKIRQPILAEKFLEMFKK